MDKIGRSIIDFAALYCSVMALFVDVIPILPIHAKTSTEKHALNMGKK